MNKQKIITWLLFFLVFFLLLQLFTKKTPPPAEFTTTPVGILVGDNEYVDGQEVTVKIKNNTRTELKIPSHCPKNPLTVLKWTGEKFEAQSAETKIDCAKLPDFQIAPEAEQTVSFSFWNHTLFGTPGRYKIELQTAIEGEQKTFTSSEFTVEEAGFFRKFFRTAFYQPLYNVLIFFISIAPARDLGFAIILLTLVIRLILLVPSQKAITSQKRMQELQPKLEAIKKKYAGNQERIGLETMQLWKEHKVSPFSSCLPLLIQFPVLIALFYVIQNGLNPDNVHFLYTPLKDVDLSNIHTHFLGILELTRVNVIVLPLMVGILQFLQLKLAGLKKKASETKEEAPRSELETANKTMTYMMPVMIALFTASVPAGVGLYWGVSTLFALGQQLVANRKK